MQLNDEVVEYAYQNALSGPADTWTLLAETQAKQLLPRARFDSFKRTIDPIWTQVKVEREAVQQPGQPDLQPGFIELPQKYLDNHRRKGEASELGQILTLAGRLREQVDRVVVLGIGGSYMGARALFEALCPSYHNELPPETRAGKPRIYFEGNGFDNDALQDLLDMLEITCVDPEYREERWGAIVISKSGETLETAAAYRIFRAEALKFYGAQPENWRIVFVPITGATGALRDLVKTEGFEESDVLTIPDNIGGRYSVFTAVGLLPAAVMGLDIRALLLGAAAMTKRFLEEPFERNPVLQYAAVNYLMNEELDKPIRVLSVWSKKLEALGFWYDQLLSESLGKQGRGATPLTAVETRDLHSRGQQHQDGQRDKFINNLVLKKGRHEPIAIGMADHNEDDLNSLSRKTYVDLVQAALQGTNQAYAEVARPTADLILPALNEHGIGQLMQMLMLATVVEGRLMGVNPYGQPGVQAYKHKMREILKGA
ncbi:MAG TPA: glucose-6-phosphate isomerase [Gemmataceae bacterium]|nr:glucose-6-phosphate isomerase [Gemmataceae bacterium]